MVLISLVFYVTQTLHTVHFPHLWECPIIPNVAFMGKYVGNIPELSFLYVLFDRVQRFLCCNLEIEALVKGYVGACFWCECTLLPVFTYTLFI